MDARKGQSQGIPVCHDTAVAGARGCGRAIRLCLAAAASCCTGAAAAAAAAAAAGTTATAASAAATQRLASCVAAGLQQAWQQANQLCNNLPRHVGYRLLCLLCLLCLLPTRTLPLLALLALAGDVLGFCENIGDSSQRRRQQVVRPSAVLRLRLLQQCDEVAPAGPFLCLQLLHGCPAVLPAQLRCAGEGCKRQAPLAGSWLRRRGCLKERQKAARLLLRLRLLRVSGRSARARRGWDAQLGPVMFKHVPEEWDCRQHAARDTAVTVACGVGKPVEQLVNHRRLLVGLQVLHWQVQLAVLLAPLRLRCLLQAGSCTSCCRGPGGSLGRCFSRRLLRLLCLPCSLRLLHLFEQIRQGCLHCVQLLALQSCNLCSRGGTQARHVQLSHRLGRNVRARPRA